MEVLIHLSVQKFCGNNKLTHQPCTKIAQSKVTKNDVPYLLSINTMASEKLVSRPKFRNGDFYGISKVDLPFRKD